VEKSKQEARPKLTGVASQVSQRVKPSDMVAARAEGSAGGPSLRVAKEAAQVAARDEGKRWFGIF
jgi:hypothetical protein